MSPRLSTLIIILILVHLALTACGPRAEEDTSPEIAAAAHKAGPANPVPVAVTRDTVPAPRNQATSEWLPSRFSLTCGAGTCPVQVGALVFVSPLTGSQVQTVRCTAFLIDQDKIMSNGHCDFVDQGEGYFFTRTDAAERTFRKISRRLFKDYTPGPSEDQSSGRPDFAIFQLETPITNIQPLHLASGAPRTYNALTAITVNSVAGQDALTLSVGQMSCTVHRNERLFPYDLSEAPDVLTVFDCAGEKGNSGSPMFAAGSFDVEAVLQGGGNLDAYAKSLREKQHREPLPFEKHTNIAASNVRCLNYPAKSGLTCTQVNDEQMRDRFAKLIVNTVKGTAEKDAPGGPYQMQFKVMAFDIKGGDEAELMYMPQCRTVATVTSFVIPSEHIRLVYDDWGKPSITSLASVASSGNILAQDATHIKVAMSWARPFGEFEKADKDLRKQLGQTFSIDLPLCSR